MRILRNTAVAGTALATALALTACGGDIPSASPSTTPCGTVNIAVNPWVGYEANAAVVEYVLEKRLNCTVSLVNLNEQVSWQGFESGSVDVILENWGHPELAEEFIDQKGVAVNVGATGNDGIIGWYVPPWLAAEHPEVTDWENLNDLAENFRTTESGAKGQLLDGDPSYVTNDEALVANLGLNFTVVYAGSETALIEAFRTAEAQRTWLIAYFYEPQWFLAEIPLVHVELPAWTEGCDADPATVACDYPPYVLDKIARKAFMESDSPAVAVIENFSWTNDDQNAVAKDIADGKSYEDAAKAWVDAHPAEVDDWLGTS
jgi:glycine betaine/proline transport system substrate-binding protein